MDYKGYKLLDKIVLVCREEAVHENSYGANGGSSCYQAYLVDPANKKQLESARQWASWIEYGPSHRGDDGKWTREYEINHDPVEFEFDNNGFTLELLDCAGGSSQGGKLSFWNCLVKKEEKTFKIGINSDMLLDLLKNAVFDKGVCQSSLIFITQNGKVGMTAEGSDTYKQCIADRELKKQISASSVSKFTFGDILKTTTISEVYLGTLNQYYTFDVGDNGNRYTKYYSFGECTLRKLAKPIKYHVFDNLYKETKLSDFVDTYEASHYSYPDLKKSCPKRTVDGKIELDMTQDEFYTRVVSNAHNFEKWLEYYNKHYCTAPNEDFALYYFLGSRSFGYAAEPFDIPEDIMRRLKEAGMKYIEE